MKLFRRIVATAAAAVLAAGIIAPAGVSAADSLIAPAETEKVAVEKLVEYKVSKKVKVEKTLTDEAGTTTVNIKAAYPYVKVAGNTALGKAIRKTLKSAVYTSIVKEYKGYLASGDVLAKDAVINVDVTYDKADFTRCGNIGSFGFVVSAGVEGGAYPVNKALVVNIDLTTGKKLTLTSLFKSATKAKSFMAKTSKNYADALYKEAAPLLALNPDLEAEYSFLEGIELADVKKAIDINSIMFNWEGIYIIFDETDDLWPHAVGTQTMFIAYDDIAPYFRESKAQLVRPYSVEVIRLEYNAGTGYSWEGGAESDGGSCLELVYETSYDLNASVMMTGGRMCQLVVYKAVAEGRADLEYKLIRPWMPDEPAETYSRKLIVTSDLFITDDNGEN